MIFTDDCSRMMWVTFLKDKTKVFNKFKAFRALVENESGRKLKCLRTDQGGEFASEEFTRYYESNGLKRQLFAPRTPQQNGIAKRNNQSVVEYARTMLIQGGVTKTFWREAIDTTVYTMNQILVKRGKDKTPYEYLYGRSPNVSYFKKFGSRCFIKRSYYIGKFDAKRDEGIFLGYSTKRKAYKYYKNQTKKIIESVNVRVDEFPEKSKENNKKEEEEPNTIFLEPESVKPEVGELNTEAPIQL